MSCTFDKELLLEFAVGEISSEQRPMVEAHLDTCALCRTEIVVHRQIARDFAALPEPSFPQDLENLLVRVSIQARRSTATGRALADARPRLRPSWVFGFGGLLGLGVLVLLVFLLWPSRIATWAPVDRAVDGGVGQGLGVLDGLMSWLSEMRAGWDIVKNFLHRLSPVEHGVRIALGGVGGGVWAALALGAIGATVLLWRITSAGQKKMRSVRHAKQQG